MISFRVVSGMPEGLWAVAWRDDDTGQLEIRLSEDATPQERRWAMHHVLATACRLHSPAALGVAA